MEKKSFVNISIVSIGNIFNTVLGFLFLTAVARTLSLEDFGKYALLTSLITFLAKGTDFGTNSLFVSKSITSNEKNLVNIFYSLKIILLLIVVPVSFIVLLALKILDPLIITVFLLGLIAYWANFTLYSLFQKEEKYIMLILVNSILAITKFIFAILIFLNLFKPTLLSSFSIFSLCVFPSLFLILFLPKDLKTFTLSFNQLGKFFKEAFPAGTSLLISEGWSAIANTITSLLNNFSNVGIYSLADKLSAIFSLISFSIFTVLLPKNSKRKKDNQEFDFKETIVISIGLLLLALVGIVVSNIIVIPIFGEHFRDSLPVLYVLLFSSAFTAINTFMENYFFVEKKTNQLLPISLTRLVSFVGLSLILLPSYSITGIAYASLVSSVSVTLMIFFIIKKTHQPVNN